MRVRPSWVRPLQCAGIELFVVVLCAGIAALILLRTRGMGTSLDNAPLPPDYAAPSSWAALPDRADNADIVPAMCGLNSQIAARADTFYVHPTSFFSSNWNAAADDLPAGVIVDIGMLPQQASAFNGATRVFAPRYRQVSMARQAEDPTGRSADLMRAMDIAYSDVARAFAYYLEHFSGGQPFIIAAHSQGTLHAARLLRDLFENSSNTTNPVADPGKRLIAAYLIGNTVEADRMPVPVCSLARQARCIVGWNTILDGGNAGSHWVKKAHNASQLVCVNPLSWAHDTSRADRALHRGAMPITGHLFLSELAPKLVSAQCGTDNVLYVSQPERWGFPASADGRLHALDYPLFYRNIRLNVQDRVDAYFNTSTPPEACLPCSENPACVWGVMVTHSSVSVAAAVLLWTVLFGAVALPCFCARHHRRTGEWPSNAEAFFCACCCCLFVSRRYWRKWRSDGPRFCFRHSVAVGPTPEGPAAPVD